MAMTLGDILVNVKADTSQLVTGFNRAERSINKTTKNMTTAVKTFAAAYISLNAIDLARKFGQQADAMTNVNSKLKLVTSSSKELMQVQKEIFKISQDTRSVFTGNIELYQRIAMSTRDLNLSQKDMLSLTKTINEAMTISGTTASGAQALVVQLGQAFSSNFQAVAQELGTIRDQAPRLYQAMLDGTGMTAAAFKKAAEEGKLSSEIIIDALRKQGIAIDRDFGKMVMTIDGATTKVQNSITTTIGKIDEMSGISAAVSNEISGISKSIDELNPERIIEVSKQIVLVGASIGGAVVALKGYSTALKIGSEASAYYAKQTALKTAVELADAKAVELGAYAQTAKTIADEANTIAMKTHSVFAIEHAKLLRTTAKEAEAAAIKQTIYARNLEVTNSALKGATLSTRALSLATKAIPFIAVASGIYAIVDALTDASKEIEWFGDKFDEAALKAKEFTKNQAALELEKVASKVRELRAEYRDLETERKGIGLFSNFTKEDAARMDTVKMKLSELSKAAKELRSIVNGEDTKQKPRVIEITKEQIKLQEEWASKSRSLALDTALVQATELEKPYIALSAKYDEDLAKYKDIVGAKTEIDANYAANLEELNKNTINKYEEDTRAFLEFREESYSKALDAQLELIQSTNEWGNSFDGIAGSINDIATSMAKMNYDDIKATKTKFDLDRRYQKFAEKNNLSEEQYSQLAIDYTKEKNALDEQNAQNQLKGYSQISGAMSQMFDEGSREAAAFKAIEAGLAAVAGVRAIMTAGTGDPYTAIPRMIATAALVAQTLSQVGIAFGAGSMSVSTSYDATAAQAANTGTGSVLGDASAESKSIKNSLSTLEDLAKPEFRLFSQMNDSLLSIDRALGGVSANILQTGGFALGEGAISSATSSENSVTSFINKTYDIVLKTSIGGVVDKLTGGLLSGVVGGIVGRVAGGLFGGGTSISTSLDDYGLLFNSQLLTAAIDNLQGSSYQTIRTVVEKKGGWFSKGSTSILYSTVLGNVEEETTRQFQLILGNLYDSVLLSGKGLEVATSAIENDLSNFYVNLGKISLKGKTGEQIQETLTAVFGKIGDELAKKAFPELIPFQKIGEGLFETMTRVSSSMEEARYYLDILGQGFEAISYTDVVKKQGDIGFEALAQSIIKTDEALYGMNNGVVQMIETLNTSASELFETYTAFELLRSQMSAMGKDAQYLTSNILLGSGGITKLSDAFDSYFENFMTQAEQNAFNTDQMRKEFTKLNLAMPDSVQGFKNLVSSIDISTSAGQELYGRVILLSDGFGSLASDIGVSLKDIEKLYTNNLDTIHNLIMGLTDSLSSTSAIDNFRIAMDKALKATDQVELSGALGEVSKYIGALSDITNFENTRDMLFAQSVARNQLIGIEDKAKTQTDYLSSIADSSALTASILSGGNYTPSISTTVSMAAPSNYEGSSLLNELISQNQKLNTIISELQANTQVAEENRDNNNSSAITLENIYKVS